MNDIVRFGWLLLCHLVLSSSLIAQSVDERVQVLVDSAAMFHRDSTSLPFLDTAFAICREAPCTVITRAQLYHQASRAYYYQWIDDNLALSYSDSAVYYCGKVKEEHGLLLAEAFNHRGRIQLFLGNNKPALDDFTRSLEVLSTAKLPSSDFPVDSVYGYWSYMQGRAATDLGDYELALTNYRTVLSKSDGYPTLELRAYYGLGAVNQKIGDFAASLDYYRKQMALTSADQLWRPHLTIGSLYLNQSMPQLADSFLQLAHQYLLSIDPEDANKNYHFWMAKSHINLTEVQILNENWEMANLHYEQGVSALRSTEDSEFSWLLGDYYLKKARIEEGQHDLEKSLVYLDSALHATIPNWRQAEVGQLILIGGFDVIPSILGLRARVQHALGQYQGALESVKVLNIVVAQNRRTYADNLSKFFLLHKVMPIYELGIQVNQELFEQTKDERYLLDAYTLNAQNKATLLLESLQADHAIDYAGVPKEVKQQEMLMRKVLADSEKDLYTSFQSQGVLNDSLQHIAKTAEQDYNLFVQELEKRYPRYYELKYRVNNSPEVSHIQDRLADDQHLVEYFVGEQNIYAFHIAIVRGDYEMYP